MLNMTSDVNSTVARIEEKALQLSGHLRELDNSPLALDSGNEELLVEALQQLQCRITATLAIYVKGSEARQDRP